jgi:SAM-dependent methyltransferase
MPATGRGRAAGLSDAQAQYARRAARYDLELLPFEPCRVRAIAALDLRAGDTVVDVGCGTGLSFPGLEQGVRSRGRIVGIEPSPDMLLRARERVAAHRWRNVHLIAAGAAEARLRGQGDAALFFFTHDVLRDEHALDHVLGHLRPGAHVVAAGLQWAPPWMGPANAFVLGAALYSTTTLEGLRKPWDRLAPRLAALRVETVGWGGIYIASGRLAG